MNKKISILTIALTGFFGLSALAEETNLGKESSDNTVTQGNINLLRNIEQPDTPIQSTIGASAKPLSTQDSGLNSKYKWNSSPMGSNMVYKVDCPNCGNGVGRNNKVLSNCPNGRITTKDGRTFCAGVDKRCYCATKDISNVDRDWNGEVGQNGECLCTVKTAKSNGYNIAKDFVGIFVNVDGSSKTTKGYVSFDDKNIQTHTDDPENIPEGFYRYYIVTKPSEYGYDKFNANDGNHPCEPTEGQQGGCWSPLYPIVNFSGFAGIKNGLLKAESDENARKNYFGTRTQYPDPQDANEANQYSNDKVPSGKAFAYRMGVKVAAVTEDNVPTGTIPNDAKTISKTNLSASSSNGKPVVLSVQRWEEQSGAKTPDGLVALSPDFNYTGLMPVKDDNENNNETSTKILDSDTDLSMVKTTSDDSILPCGMFTKTTFPVGSYFDSNKNSVQCSENYMRVQRNNSGEKLFTKFRVALPTNTGYEPNYTKDLNYRACAQCVGLTEGNCYMIVKSIIQQLPQGQKTLSNLISELRKETLQVNVSNGNVTNYGYYKGKFTCETCLGKLDTLLGGNTDTAQELRNMFVDEKNN